MSQVIVISDSKEVRSSFESAAVSSHFFDPNDSGLAANGRIAALGEMGIAFVDLSSPGWKAWMEALRYKVPLVGFSAPDVSAAVEAMHDGALDILDRIPGPEAIRSALDRYQENAAETATGFDDIVGTSAVMREVFSLIKKAAVSESNVLITGESGTGKEPTARSIHRWSPRRDRSFMTLNCSAIPDTLLESELFGFEKGAFTGANYTKKGILEIANGGTVFFDEIGDVSTLFQTKILRVIQEGEIMRIGGAKHTKVDVRIIAATNKDLKLACKKGAFREDLFYRLNVINIHLPPLRQRMEDVPLLARHFVRKYAPKRKDIVITGIGDDALHILTGYNYPGNVRELENIIEHAISFAGNQEILPVDLPHYLHQAGARRRTSTPKMKEAVASFERELIWAALQEARGNISKAASILGIYRQQLQRKIKQLKISV